MVIPTGKTCSIANSSAIRIRSSALSSILARMPPHAGWCKFLDERPSCLKKSVRNNNNPALRGERMLSPEIEAGYCITRQASQVRLHGPYLDSHSGCRCWELWLPLRQSVRIARNENVSFAFYHYTYLYPWKLLCSLRDRSPL